MIDIKDIKNINEHLFHFNYFFFSIFLNNDVDFRTSHPYTNIYTFTEF